MNDVAVMVCFIDHHEMVVPSHVNRYPICDLPLWGSDKQLASTLPIRSNFETFE